jgi:predicted ester cyclase
MSDRKALVQRFYDEVAGKGNLDMVDEVLTEDFVEHEEFPGISPDREGVKQFFAYLRSAFPDVRLHAEETVEEGDFVTARLRITGTHEGEFLGVQPTGRQIDITGFDMLHFSGEQVTDHWGVTDVMALMTQLGAMPGPPG